MAANSQRVPLEHASEGWLARTIRPALWLGVVFNAMVAGMVAFPETLGVFAALPPVGSTFYRLMLVYFVVLFSATYGWLAMQPVISRPVVGLAVLGKAGVFVVAAWCLARGEIAPRTFAVASGDLVFASYFCLWLRATRAVAVP
jgi:hypothetical protein